MSIKIIKSAALVLCGAFALSSSAVFAAEQEAKSLDELLGFVKQGQVTEAKENRAREQAFSNAKADQARLLREAEAERTRQENRSAKLENAFEENELLISAKQKQLKEKLGTLAELFGHLTSATGDLASNLERSLVSAQYPGRETFLTDLIEKMSKSDELPSIEEIERVWFELQREMVESGKVVSFSALVSKPNGDKVQQKVVRIGSFNILSEEGKYLQFVPSKGTLEELSRQPSSRYLNWGEDLASATSGLHQIGLDPTGPTGGSYLAALINSPNLEERWHQGGPVGYAITVVGVLAAALAIYRFIVLTFVSRKVSAQLKSSTANKNNPLGRTIMVHENNPTTDTETLELKMSEAIMKETPALESGLTLLKITAAVAPLMGLLGTVVGMIQTFQAITIFGAGDPQAMAGGISGALITTVLGLLVAIPIVLMHTVVNGKAQRIIHILNEQATGIVAEHNEANLGK